MGALTESQKSTIEAVQRMSSVLSIIGASFIIVTFLGSSRFQKPINRLAFYAAIANILSTVATTIARAGPNAGRDSALCKMQGVFIQTFLQSDALFIAFMALNVYLTVNLKWGSAQLRRLEPYYVVVSFGLPLLSGLIMLGAHDKAKGPIYGDATLWCWISSEYDVLRLATFYGPVWIIIFITIALYAVTGKVVFKMRNDLRRFGQKNHPQHQKSSSQTDLSSSAAPSGKSVTAAAAIQMTAVTQIDVQNEHINDVKPIGCTYLAAEGEAYKYTVTIEAQAGQPKSKYTEAEIDFDNSTNDVENDGDMDEFQRGRTVSVASASTSSATSSTKKPIVVSSNAPLPIINRNAIVANRKTMRANAAAWAYTRCSFLFFIGLLITWLPSSTNRVYGFIHPDDQQFGLYLTAGLVLPAQGLWNFVIYITTSWTSCQLMWRDISIHFASGLVRKKPSIESIPRNDRLKLPS